MVERYTSGLSNDINAGQSSEEINFRQKEILLNPITNKYNQKVSSDKMRKIWIDLQKTLS